jgi:hypothetical protein
MLPQEQIIAAEVVLRSGGGIALEVIGKPEEVADVFLFGGLTVIFELDKLGEL